MSHNVRLQGVKFRDLSILRAAIDELNAEGAQLELVQGEGLTARSSRYAGAGNMTCDTMIRINDGQWDIALRKNDQGEYIPELESDLRNPHLMDQGGVPVEGCRVDYNGIQLGKLSQRYALLQAEINAAQSGYATTRTYDQSKRQFLLEVGV